MLGERERNDVGVEGMDDDEKERFEGYGSLNFAAAVARDGLEILVRSGDAVACAIC